VALVTGGGSGIGFEVARQLGLHGAKVRLFLTRSPAKQGAQTQRIHMLTHTYSLAYMQVVIMGRRGPFLEKAVAILKQDGVQATCTYQSKQAGGQVRRNHLLTTKALHHPYRVSRRRAAARGR